MILEVKIDGHAIVDRAAERVPAHIVSEGTARLLVVIHQGGTGEADKRGVRKSLTHRAGQFPVLRAVSLVGNDHNSMAPGERFIILAWLLDTELLDQSEEDKMRLAQQAFKLDAIPGVDLPWIGLFDSPGVFEVLVNLLIEIDAVGNNEKLIGIGEHAL